MDPNFSEEPATLRTSSLSQYDAWNKLCTVRLKFPTFWHLIYYKETKRTSSKVFKIINLVNKHKNSKHNGKKIVWLYFINPVHKFMCIIFELHLLPRTHFMRDFLQNRSLLHLLITKTKYFRNIKQRVRLKSNETTLLQKIIHTRV
jgi:hypothetical protein